MHGHPPYHVQFLQALLLTLAVETAMLFLLVRRGYKLPASAVSNTLLLFAGVYCSFATLPYLWFVLPHVLKPYLVLAIGGEILIFLVETVFYYFVLRLGLRRSLLASGLCNAASILAGLCVL